MPKNRLYEPPIRPELEVDKNRIGVGSKVLISIDQNPAFRLTILSPNQGNPDLGTISSDAPLARAILGRQPRETATYTVAEQIHKVRIIEVS